MKQLKRHLIIIAILLISVSVMAQESPAQKWIQSFEGRSGITTVSISSTMFKMLSKISSSDPEYKEVLRFANKLQEFKIVVVEEDHAAGKTNAKTDFNRLVGTAPLANFEELMSVNEGGNHIVFRVQERNDRIQELMMTITGSDQVILFIKGDFSLKELTEISDDVNITGINKLKKLKK